MSRKAPARPGGRRDAVEATAAPDRVLTDPRLSRRRRAVRRLRRRRAALRAMVGLALAAALWVAFWSPLLRVRAVEVVGGRHTSASQVAAVAGLDSGPNLLLLSTAEIAQRAATLPWVKRARVERKLPGTLKVRVTERRPSLVVAEPARRYTIDLRGRVLARGEVGRDLPHLVTDSEEAVRPGDRIAQPAARAGLRAYRSLPDGLRADVRAAFAPTVERISLALADGTLVRFGAAEHVRAKARVLRALLGHLRAQGAVAGYVDVRVPESPATSAAPPRDVAEPAVHPGATPAPSGR